MFGDNNLNLSFGERHISLQLGVVDSKNPTSEYVMHKTAFNLPNTGIIGVHEGPYALRISNAVHERIALAIYIDGVNIGDGVSTIPANPAILNNHAASCVITQRSTNYLDAWMTAKAPQLVFTERTWYKVAYHQIGNDFKSSEGKIMIFAFIEEPVTETPQVTTRSMGTGAGKNTYQSWGTTTFPRPRYLGTGTIFYTAYQNMLHLGDTRVSKVAPQLDKIDPLDMIPRIF